MFFSKKIKTIRPEYKVLEIGPGASPHPRSDAFLELDFKTTQDKISQRGGGLLDANFENKPVYFYDGNKFPFEDDQFDYVICSHVIEHVSDPLSFLNEVFRVGSGRGYLEYPLATYEYLYNFEVHLNFIKFDFEKKILKFLPKKETLFSEFSAINLIFYKSLARGWDDLCAANKDLFFEGFEFDRPFLVEKSTNIAEFAPSDSVLIYKSFPRKLISRISNKIFK
jgi:SAM-dependent methyltransferase